MESIRRFFSPPKQSYFLFGPRGTGKTTCLKERYPKALYIDLLLSDVFRDYSARPERLRDVVAAHRDKRIVIIDEIQRIPELLSVVHHLIEDNKATQFILTGSSARKIKSTGANLLGGRAMLRKMHPFTAAELSGTFDFEQALIHGSIPIVRASENMRDTLNAYIDVYIREEVLMEGLTRNVGNFSRFLEAVSFSHGSVINVSNIARDCGIERKVIGNYLTILEDLLLASRVPVFTKRAARAVIQHPKFYYFDSGVFTTLRPRGPLDKPEEVQGAALEGLVYQNLQAWLDYFHPDCRVYFWRTSSGNEVDFILYGPEMFTAIEVKNASSIRPADMRGLRSFAEDYPESERIILYRGKEKLSIHGITIIPCEEYLLSLRGHSEG